MSNANGKRVGGGTVTFIKTVSTNNLHESINIKTDSPLLSFFLFSRFHLPEKRKLC